MPNKEDALLPYEKKSIYVLVKKLLFETTVITAKLPKMYKYTLGKSLSNGALTLARSIYKALELDVKGQEKVNAVFQVKENIHDMLLLYRISLDITQPCHTESKEQIASLLSMADQANKWYLYLKKQLSQST